MAAKDESSTSLLVRVVALILVGGLIFTAFLPLADVFQANDVEKLVDAQLSRIPVFTVTDGTGRPYMSESDDHRLRRGFFFVQPADAEKYLLQVQGKNPDSRVLAVGLNKAITFLDTKTSLKTIPEKFELFPDDHEAALAQELTAGSFQQTFGQSAVPIFYLEGLAVKDSNEGTAAYPLFFEKEKLDEAVANLKKADPTTNLGLENMEIIDLKQTIREIRAGSNPRLSRVAFVPLTGSLEKLKALSAEP